MTKDMTTGSSLKIILLFSIPVLLGNLFQQFYNMVDTVSYTHLDVYKRQGALSTTYMVSLSPVFR